MVLPPSNLSRCLVACNVYVSAGANPIHRDLLLSLLKDTQKHCQQQEQSNQAALPRDASSKLRKDNNNQFLRISGRVMLVHAFADGPYDRSSFHIAGSPNLVTNAVSRLATNAIQVLASSSSSIQQQDTSSSSTSTTAHPTVGLVDHISILPLTNTNDELDSDDDGHTEKMMLSREQWHEYYSSLTIDSSRNASSSPSSSSDVDNDEKIITTTEGWVAIEIGNALENIGVDVLYYGYAHPDNTPLAQIRRDRTNFFKNNNRAVSSSPRKTIELGQATIGAPPHFVENYNVRLSNKCPKKVAISLTKYLRQELEYLESLTLPYSHQSYESACNLLNPDVTSARDVEMKVEEWLLKTQANNPNENDDDNNNLVEIGYRVGTTASQCLEALKETSESMEAVQAYDHQVYQRFESYF